MYDGLITYADTNETQNIVERLFDLIDDCNKSEYHDIAISLFVNDYVAFPEEFKKNPMVFNKMIDILKDSSNWKQQLEAISGFINAFDDTYDITHGRDLDMDFTDEFKQLIEDNLILLSNVVTNITNHLKTEYENNPEEFKIQMSTTVIDFYEMIPKILRTKELKQLYRLFISKKLWSNK